MNKDICFRTFTFSKEVVPKERIGQIQIEATELMRIIGAIIVKTKESKN